MHQMLHACRYRGEWFDTDVGVVDIAFQLAMDIGEDPALWLSPEEALKCQAYAKNWKSIHPQAAQAYEERLAQEGLVEEEPQKSIAERIRLWHLGFDGALKRTQLDFRMLSMFRERPQQEREALRKAIHHLQQRIEYLKGKSY